MESSESCIKMLSPEERKRSSPEKFFRSSRRKRAIIDAIRNRADQETPNQSSANRLHKPSQTINRTDQETPNEPCVKENDYTNRFVTSDIKPRGKMPSEHRKILQKHYPSIMDNIRVDDIMGHLFSGEVIDWNEMDVIETKLRSEGNREALRYLIKIHFNPGTALASFIQCLHQTGYIHIAELLQDDLGDVSLNFNTCHELQQNMAGNIDPEQKVSSINQLVTRERIHMADESVLIKHREELIRQIIPKYIINSLLQRQVIDSDDLNEIKQEERIEGRVAGVEKLLDRIYHSGPDGLDKFIDSLQCSGYATLAEKLQESRQ